MARRNTAFWVFGRVQIEEKYRPYYSPNVRGGTVESEVSGSKSFRGYLFPIVALFVDGTYGYSVRPFFLHYGLTLADDVAFDSWYVPRSSSL